jgi:uncharacterized protein YfaS (alpha-2-macroglobulin family)
MLLASQNNLPLDFTQGDDVTLNLIATDDQGNPQNLTGASLSTQILGPNGSGPVTFPNSQHTIANQITNPGQFSLTLRNAGSDTTSCGEGPSKQIITQSTVSGNVTYFRGMGLLTVYPNVPTQ